MDRIFLFNTYSRSLRWLLTGFLCLSLGAAHPYPKQTDAYSIFLENDKKGLRDHNQKVLIPATYDDLGWSSGGFLPKDGVLGYKENGLWGLVNLKNRKIISPHYTFLSPLKNGMIIAAKYDHISKQQIFGVINLKGNVVLPFDYHHLQGFNSLIIASVQRAGMWKYGLLNYDFQAVTPYSYDEIEPLNDSYAIVEQTGKLGLLNSLGQLVIPPKYQEIQLAEGLVKGKPFNSYELKTAQNKHVATHAVSNLKVVDRNLYLSADINGSHLINTLGSEIKSFANCQIGEFQEGIAIIRQENQYGVVNIKGQVLLPLEYDSLWIDGGYLGIQHKNLNWMLLNAQLVRITQKDYQEIHKSSEGLFPVKRHGTWGFVNNRGVEVIPPQYQAVKSFVNGVAQANYSGSWGLIDRAGNWLIRPMYHSLDQVAENIFLFQNNINWGLIHTAEGTLYQTRNALIATPTAIIEKNERDQYGLISLRGEQFLTTRYDQIHLLQDTPNYYHYQDSVGPGLFNIISRTFINDPSFQELRTINEDFIGVKINNQYGFVDLNGKLRIANRYQNVGVFNETMSPIKIKNKWGYIDRLERLKIQPIYDMAGPFEKGLAVVSQKGKYGIVNVKGQVLLPLKYDQIERLVDGRFQCSQGKSKGLVDATGKVLLSPKYDQFEDLGNGFIIVNRGTKFSLVSDQGVSVIPMIYDHIQYDTLNDLYILQKKQPWETIKL